MSWFVAKGGGDIAGMAWLGTLCRIDKGLMTNINEKQRTAAKTGFVSFNTSPTIIILFQSNRQYIIFPSSTFVIFLQASCS